MSYVTIAWTVRSDERGEGQDFDGFESFHQEMGVTRTTAFGHEQER